MCPYKQINCVAMGSHLCLTIANLSLLTDRGCNDGLPCAVLRWSTCHYEQKDGVAMGSHLVPLH